ncbi:MAG: glycosyl transferase family 28 [Flavobacteriales bacterium CG_4_9_14_3_um_filter_32_8]|nr:MAG: glycosyl transferase family 28 [Flavobacteriales bacterium CG_4_9_14_3_um_filter_32_8]
MPVIKELLRLGHHVIIGADKNPLAFLQQEFPKLPTVIIPGYEVNYGKKGNFFQLFCESVRFYQAIKKEHQFIEKIVAENNIDIIISDNRYGLWCKKVKSILITHQLFVKTPVGSSFVHHKIEKLINNFDECWIPDVENETNLSGDLSHQKMIKFPHRFIGPLSRFTSLQAERSNLIVKEYDVIAIISGPEPQRTIFENLILEQLQNTQLKTVMVRGLPNKIKGTRNKGQGESDKGKGTRGDGQEKKMQEIRDKYEISIFNHLKTEELQDFILKSKVVVARSGYSTIMDLVTFGEKAILIPTPGQTEQEYLAKYHFEQGNFYTQKQSELDLQKGMLEAEQFSPTINKVYQLKLDFLE